MLSEDIKKYLSKGLIVSCQALADEPLHSSFIMSKMALAAKQGGARAIRANGIEDIIEIKQEVDLPIIGIIKKIYDSSDVYITPTIKEIDDLARIKVDIIALDATNRTRPNDETLSQIVTYTKTKYPDIILMADCSCIEDIIQANILNFDIVATTLVGYTKETQGNSISANEFKLLKEMIAHNEKALFVVEGNIMTPEQANQALLFGADTVVVGGMITRPQLITKRFVEALSNE